MMRWFKNVAVVLVAMVVSAVVVERDARADIVYRADAFEPNYVPFGEDGTPGRPAPGDFLGNTIVLAGTNRTLDRISVGVALNNSVGMPDAVTDTWFLDLYMNDGDIDPKSGLQQPFTLIASASTVVAMPPFSQLIAFDFSGGGVVVPDFFTVVIHSSHPTDTFFQSPGVSGPFSTAAPPSVGGGANTIWYNTTTVETNSTWAIADGATTNFFFMTVEASP